MADKTTETKQTAALNGQSALKQFVFEKTEKVSEVAHEAQRLINLYRQLSTLGDDFIPTFDKMLLASTPEVQLMLSSLSSGDTVREYLKFLQGKKAQNGMEGDESAAEESKTFYEDSSVYLPSADEIPAFQMSSGAVGGSSASPELISAVLKSVSESQQKASQQQADFFQKALVQMRESLMRMPADETVNPMELRREQQRLMNDTIERLSIEQTRILSESLSEVLKNTQTIAHEQVADIVAQITQSHAYPTIDEVEELPTVVQAPQTPSREKPAGKPSVSAPRVTEAGRVVYEPKYKPAAPRMPEDAEILSEIELPKSEE